MRSFRLRMRRTHNYQKNGHPIYNTFNDTGLARQYQSKSARFDSRCKLARNGGARGCTNIGCGPNCCLSLFLLTDISGETWDKLSNGMVFSKGVSMYTSTNKIGTIYNVIYPYVDCCPTRGVPAEEQKNKFPIDIRLVVTPSSGICNQRIWQPGMGIRFGGKGLAGHIYTLTSAEAEIEKGPWVKTGTSNIGSPYRNPIAGFRKTLVCCDPGQIKCQECVMIYEIVDYAGQGPGIGDDVNTVEGELIGQVIGVVNSGQGGGLITVKPVEDCESVDRQPGRLYFGGIAQTITRVTIKTVNVDCVKLPPTNDVYKDSIATTCQIDKRACYRPRIRSGMQPKQQFCIQYQKQKNGTYRKYRRLLCPKDLGWQKAYSFSYSQYNKNRALNTYERGLEKNIPVQDQPSSSCPAECGNPLYPNKQCCLKSQYRKSAGNACLNCNQTVTPVQTFIIQGIAPQDENLIKDAQIRIVTQNTSDPHHGPLIGAVESFIIRPNTVSTFIRMTLNGNGIVSGDSPLGFSTPSSTGFVVPATLLKEISAITPLSLEGQIQGNLKRMSRHAVTVWKPNNNKFKVQGSVSSGSRMERLKLDTITAANSKCKKGQRCSKSGTGNGPYLAGRPRFTGWPYTRRHPETLCMNKYRQQPHGISQLVRHGRATRSNRPGPELETSGSHKRREPFSAELGDL